MKIKSRLAVGDYLSGWDDALSPELFRGTPAGLRSLVEESELFRGTAEYLVGGDRYWSEGARVAFDFTKRIMSLSVAQLMELEPGGLKNVELACLWGVGERLLENCSALDRAARERIVETNENILRALAWSTEGAAIIDYELVYQRVSDWYRESCTWSRLTSLTQKALAESLLYHKGVGAMGWMRLLASDALACGDHQRAVDMLAALIAGDSADCETLREVAEHCFEQEWYDTLGLAARRGLDLVSQVGETACYQLDFVDFADQASGLAEEGDCEAPDDLDLSRLRNALQSDASWESDRSLDALAKTVVPEIESIPVKKISGREAERTNPLPYLPLAGIQTKPFCEQSDDELVEMLCELDLEVPRGLAEEIVRRGSSMVDPLGAVLAGTHPKLRADDNTWNEVHSLYLLGAIGDGAAGRHVVDWLRNYPETEHAHAAVTAAIGRLDPGAIDAVVSYVNDPCQDFVLREAAIQGLVQIGYHRPEQRQALKKLFLGLFQSAIASEDEHLVTGLVAALHNVPDNDIQAAITAAFDAELVDGACSYLEDADARLNGDPAWSSHGYDRDPLAHFGRLRMQELKNIREESNRRFTGWWETLQDELRQTPSGGETAKKQNQKTRVQRKRAKKSRRKNRGR